MIDMEKIRQAIPEDSDYIVLILDEKGRQEAHLCDGDVSVQLGLVCSYFYVTIQNIMNRHPEMTYESVEDDLFRRLCIEMSFARSREETVRSMMEEGASEEEARTLLKEIDKIVRGRLEEGDYETPEN